MSRTSKPYPSEVATLKNIVTKDWSLPNTSVDEVYPGIFVGNAIIAKDIRALAHLGVTHIINAACGVDSIRFVDTSELFYISRNYKCKFLGIPAMDVPTYQLNRYFNETSAFIDDAVQSGGKCLIHCIQGISRSATLVIAYLMMKKELTVYDALSLVRNKRKIWPNDGFLVQLLELGSYHSRMRIAYQQNNYSLR
ncbi:dual specificity protein phosphatase 3 [Folsomia candida]|uniref:Dual specificity protein phosphatase n=1 Tax=Folsomia candida TaxID=158441 RepID=A0A226DXT4_FOLCA|nr:dual specificity protein phosphatase 3 [Folsomia candida]OXA50272.1 Dual specificity protein phosphatase 3 [Folsomia candida]